MVVLFSYQFQRSEKLYWHIRANRFGRAAEPSRCALGSDVAVEDRANAAPLSGRHEAHGRLVGDS